jgi:ribose 5-phosphate isomerase B
MENRKILIASDHAGFLQKEFLKEKLIAANFQVQDEGCHSRESVHYPEFAALLAGKIKAGFQGYGVLICGSGQGMMMAANRFSGVRAGLAWNEEIARLMRSHNDAQIICFGARFTADEYAWQMLQVFLNTPFEGGKHAVRTGIMDNIA